MIALQSKHLRFAMYGVMTLFCWPRRAHTQSFLYPGIQPAGEAGLSQTNTSGATAVPWNPANILEMTQARPRSKKKGLKALSGVEPYADVSLMKLSYVYTRPGYDPVPISVIAPPITVGAAWKPRSNFALGILFVPRPAVSPQVVYNLPVMQGGEVMVVDSELLSSSVTSSFGVAFKPHSKFSLGLSAIETAETGKLSLTPVDESGSVPLFQMNYSGSFFQFLLGTRVAINPTLDLGASYKTAVVKKYSGDISIGGSDTEATTKQGYLPAEFALGMEYKLQGPHVVMGEYRRHMWAAGKSQVHAGTPGGAESKDLKDVNILILGGRFEVAARHTVSAAYGYYPANCGFGSAYDAAGLPQGEQIDGVEMGDFDALNRHVIATGYRFSMTKQNAYVQTAFSLQSGTRTVPTSHANEGTFKFTAYTLGVGGGKTF